MPRKKKQQQPQQKTLEQRMEAMKVSADAAAAEADKAAAASTDRKDLAWLTNLIRNRDSFDAIVTKHIFDKLKNTGVGNEKIVEILIETGCPLDFALLMENADVTRMLLERKEAPISKSESCILVEIAMRSVYLGNLRVLVQYGPGASERRDIFTTKMFDMINGPNATLSLAKNYVEKLIAADVIDEYTFQFLEKTFETGRTDAVRMLLDCKVDDYVRNKCGDDLLVHMFGNVNLDIVEMLRGKRFNVNAKCGEMSALHFATFIKSDRNVRILLNSGADPNIRDCNGFTPLFAFGDDKCIELLLQNGADVQAIADNGYTILDMIFQPSLLGIMLAHIALIEAEGTEIKTEIRNKILTKPGFNDFYEKCCKQIQFMESCRIHDDFVLLTALFEEPECIARYVNSQETAVELIAECRNLKIHPYYLTTIEKHINQAFTVFNLSCKAAEILLKVFEPFGLDKLIVEKIVDYLSLEDLLAFV